MNFKDVIENCVINPIFTIYNTIQQNNKIDLKMIIIGGTAVNYWLNKANYTNSPIEITDIDLKFWSDTNNYHIEQKKELFHKILNQLNNKNIKWCITGENKTIYINNLNLLLEIFKEQSLKLEYKTVDYLLCTIYIKNDENNKASPLVDFSHIVNPYNFYDTNTLCEKIFLKKSNIIFNYTDNYPIASLEFTILDTVRMIYICNFKIKTYLVKYVYLICAYRALNNETKIDNENNYIKLYMNRFKDINYTTNEFTILVQRKEIKKIFSDINFDYGILSTCFDHYTDIKMEVNGGKISTKNVENVQQKIINKNVKVSNEQQIMAETDEELATKDNKIYETFLTKNYLLKKLK